jgi:hypothetical protein
MIIWDSWEKAKDKERQLTGRRRFNNYQWILYLRSFSIRVSESRVSFFITNLLGILLSFVVLIYSEKTKPLVAGFLSLLLPFAVAKSMNFVIFVGKALSLTDRDFLIFLEKLVLLSSCGIFRIHIPKVDAIETDEEPEEELEEDHEIFPAVSLPVNSHNALAGLPCDDILEFEIDSHSYSLGSTDSGIILSDSNSSSFQSSILSSIQSNSFNSYATSSSTIRSYDSSQCSSVSSMTSCSRLSSRYQEALSPRLQLDVLDEMYSSFMLKYNPVADDIETDDSSVITSDFMVSSINSSDQMFFLSNSSTVYQDEASCSYHVMS